MVGLNMFPASTLNNAIDAGRCYTKSGSNAALTFTLAYPKPNSKNMACCEGRTTPLFPHHICHVVGPSSEKQMCRIHAQSIIAGMTDIFMWFGNRIMMKRPKQSMGCPKFLVKSNMPIFLSLFSRRGAAPNPATCVEIYVV
jgi:hypothetical protein